ncbi:MAG: flagellar biosynthetic protein FliO [Bryobacteraceae bacterium]|jgi:flagellar biosynthetic protein FliO
MVEQTLAVFLVLALLILVLWFLRRKGLAKMSLAVGGRRTAAGRIQVVDRKPLTASHSLHLVRVQDRLILVGISPGSCQALHTFVAEPETADPPGSTG